MVPAPLVAVIIAALASLSAPATALAERTGECSSSVSGAGSFVNAGVECTSTPTIEDTPASAPAPGGNAPYYTEYRWVSPCGNALEDIGSEAGPCPAEMSRWCPEDATLALLQGRHDGTWHNLGHRCLLPDDSEASPPTVTAEMVAREFARIPLPQLPVVTEPAGRTLVNLPTYLHVAAKPLRRTVVLVGQQVDLDIAPARFRWVHGDGTESTGTDPGAPYPEGRVSHRYQRSATAVQPQVEITWTARWRLAGGAWQPVTGSVHTTGTGTPFDVVEATPVLTGSHR